ncbi:hypothetical protein FI667_g11893, partial [Globisporangium splendens]
MAHTATLSNDVLSTMELFEFIDDLEVFADSEGLAQERVSTDATAAASKATRHADSSHRHLPAMHVGSTPALSDAELTTAMSQLVGEQLTHLPLNGDDDDDSFLDPLLEDLDNVHTDGDATAPTTPLASQRSSLPSPVGLKAGACGDGGVDMEEQTFTSKKKTSGQRQREEIAYLRGRVRELGVRLEAIKDEMAATGSSATAGNIVDSVWVTTAKRQLERKNRAEVENMLLREKFAGEIRFAKSLERMLRKRKIWDGLQEKRKQPRFIELHHVQDSEIFEMLTRHVNESVRTLGVVPDAKGFTDGNSSSSSSPKAFTDDEDGVRIELVTAATVPFDFQKIADIAWTRIRPLISRLSCPKTTTHVFHQTEDYFVRKEVRTLQLAGDTHQTTIHAVCKRVIQENRVVMLHESLTEIRGPCGVQCVQVRSRGCGEILRGEVTANGSPSTLLRSTMSVVPHMVLDANTSIAFNEDGSAPKVPKRKSEMIGLLSELLIASHQRNAQTSQQFIENALFDDLLHGKNSSL